MLRHCPFRTDFLLLLGFCDIAVRCAGNLRHHGRRAVRRSGLAEQPTEKQKKMKIKWRNIVRLLFKLFSSNPTLIAGCPKQMIVIMRRFRVAVSVKLCKNAQTRKRLFGSITTPLRWSEPSHTVTPAQPTQQSKAVFSLKSSTSETSPIPFGRRGPQTLITLAAPQD